MVYFHTEPVAGPSGETRRSARLRGQPPLPSLALQFSDDDDDGNYYI